MSKVSKLAIKACVDNKFSSFTGEFTTSINPEHLVIKSSIDYHIPQGMAGANLLQYRGSPPKLLSFGLLFDNTGIIPGSNTIQVMEQVKQLQDVAYNTHKKKNGPNYIRVIWGEIDFKGRLVDLDITYTRFQVDGTLVRAEAQIAVLEEMIPSGQGKTAAGVDGTHEKLSTTTVRSLSGAPPAIAGGDTFAETPDGMDGAYSGAPDGAYDGGPDAPYQGAPTADSSMHRDAAVDGTDAGARDKEGVPSTSGAGSGTEGVAGNGPGGSGGAVGGGGNEPGSGAPSKDKPGGGKATDKKSAPTKPSKDRSRMDKVPKKSGIGGSSGKLDSLRKLKGAAAGAATAASVAVAIAAGKSVLDKIKDQFSWWERLKMLAKKVAPKVYDAGKKVAGKGKDLAHKGYDAGKKVAGKGKDLAHKGYDAGKDAVHEGINKSKDTASAVKDKI